MVRTMRFSLSLHEDSDVAESVTRRQSDKGDAPLKGSLYFSHQGTGDDVAGVRFGDDEGEANRSATGDKSKASGNHSGEFRASVRFRNDNESLSLSDQGDHVGTAIRCDDEEKANTNAESQSPGKSPNKLRMSNNEIHNIRDRRTLLVRQPTVRERRSHLQNQVNTMAFMSCRQGLCALEELSELRDASDDDPFDNRKETNTVPFYAPPVQRQRWGQQGGLPHVNWGDLFFDLFYVAAAYNLGSMLTTALTPSLWYRGVLYFAAIFGPLFNIWRSKLYYDARFTVIDYAHRISEVTRICFLSFTVLHIKTFDLMSDPMSLEMFCFTLGLFLESLMRIAMEVELIMKGRGDKTAIKALSKRKLRDSIIPMSCVYLAAVIVSGISYIHHQQTYISYESFELYGDEDEGSHSDYRSVGTDTDTATVGESGHHVRILGSDNVPAAEYGGGGFKMADLPLVLCLVAYVVDTAAHAYKKVCIQSRDDIQKISVPLNVDFCIHRYGEWIMLMLGESILSLLIVPTAESRVYYVVVLMGVLTVVMVQTVHFESQPSQADGHAMKRSKTGRVLYGLVIELYSMGLIAVGVSYKVMLTDIHSSSEVYNGNHRSLLEMMTGIAGGGIAGHRNLGGAIEVSSTASVALNCLALAFTLAALEMMTLTHKGLSANLKRCYSSSDSGGTLNIRWPLVVLVVVKVALLAVTSTLFVMTKNYGWIVFSGLFIVIAFALTRIVGWSIINQQHLVKTSTISKKFGRLTKISESDDFNP